MADSPRDDIKAKLNFETSRIHWHELQTYYARGQVVRVAPELDLLNVAAELTADNKAQFEQWMTAGLVGDVAPDLGPSWCGGRGEPWGVAIAPWVLGTDGPGTSLHWFFPLVGLFPA